MTLAPVSLVPLRAEAPRSAGPAFGPGMRRLAGSAMWRMADAMCRDDQSCAAKAVATGLGPVSRTGPRGKAARRETLALGRDLIGPAAGGEERSARLERSCAGKTADPVSRVARGHGAARSDALACGMMRPAGHDAGRSGRTGGGGGRLP